MINFLCVRMNVNHHILFFTFQRPWYVQAATVFPKDIVICIDRSESIKVVWDDTKQAVKTLFTTFNSNDRVRSLFPIQSKLT